MKHYKILKLFPIIIALTVYTLLLFIGVFGNPLSSERIVGVYKKVNEQDFKNNPYIDFYDDDYEKGVSERYYINNDDKVRIVLGKREFDSKNSWEPIMDCAEDQYHIEDLIDESMQKCVSKDEVKDSNIHPLPQFSSLSIDNKNNFFILGTIADSRYDIGIDRLSYLSNAVLESTKLSALSLIAFLIFGLYFGITIGYYKDRNRFLSTVNQFMLKSFESVPIILWILITIIIFDYNQSIAASSKIYIYFTLFGVFSSPALSNLIIEKINQMKNEDFIVALKLLGLKDRKIIFSHMIRYFCLPIIYFQIAYIMAHSFFLDITLSFIERNTSELPTFGFYIIQSSRYKDFFGNDFIFLIIPAFIIAFIFYKIASLAKEKL